MSMPSTTGGLRSRSHAMYDTDADLRFCSKKARDVAVVRHNGTYGSERCCLKHRHLYSTHY